MLFGVVNKDGQRLVNRYWDEERMVKRVENEPDKIFFLPECWENFIESIRYKKGWEFKLYYDIDYDQEILSISAKVPDRDNPEKFKKISQTFKLPTWSNTRVAKVRLRYWIADVEMDVLDENLMIDGVRGFNPHEDDVAQ